MGPPAVFVSRHVAKLPGRHFPAFPFFPPRNRCVFVSLPLGLNHKNWKIINKKIQLNVKENS